MISALKRIRNHNTWKTPLALLVSATLITTLAWYNTSLAEEANQHEHEHEHTHAHNASDTDNAQTEASMPDTRILVELPESIKTSTLADMRKHLRGIQEIQTALAKLQFTQASEIAKDLLGAPKNHKGHAGPYMPAPMLQIGQSMHRAAKQFSVEAEDASNINDLPYTLEALSKVTQNCVACHAAYRFQ